ncbi:YifB family Mg chelatase-like AAA ATPase [Anaerosacchariphilus sp. NSJ-68]|uniref:YifB family Mg chelatase-like AAA ATPase n=2 Tax=Lachnospiraceae TaxID=186803 RepID=A0A923LCQ1_9FIRM|nr:MULTISPECIES: YifB family Mg chelatase-like AAA ATPase [Lachnospiraceae]MBC5660109.1 YifB family Mg chelatase-like AAA ATPase [Anaerosacchariphilus hominis]MBC5699224.1 YifB family Mg chelatase-like AAA ATPase [Roseburia difficilis]
MFCKVLSAGLGGMDAYPVRVEADVSEGMPGFQMVGYLASEVREAADRVRTALRNNGCPLPPKRITVNLAPAAVKKAGSRYDLAVAAAVLGATERIPTEGLARLMIAGELSLSGQVLGISGVLPLVEMAKRKGIRRCIVPTVNAGEGAVLDQIEVIGVADLQELMEILRHPEKARVTWVDREKLWREKRSMSAEGADDFSQIHGQAAVRRAAEVAAAGMHNFLMIGPSGSGKTMIARRIPGILPSLSLEECLELTRIYSVAGLLPEKQALLTERPFRAPHHTTTAEALAGGGKIPKPGQISLSSGGILFLDELPEFRRTALEILRQPLEEQKVCISRTAGTYTFPADFMLVAAMNPCACGYFPDRNRCRCTPREILRYLEKISQPLLDRIDICVEVPKLSCRELQGRGSSESSENIRKRVEAARQMQKERCEKKGMADCVNARLGFGDMERYCVLEEKERKLLEDAYERLKLSARGYHRTIRVARTIADLEQSERIREPHILEALGYRPPNRNDWMREV